MNQILVEDERVVFLTGGAKSAAQRYEGRTTSMSSKSRARCSSSAGPNGFCKLGEWRRRAGAPTVGTASYWRRVKLGSPASEA